MSPAAAVMVNVALLSLRESIPNAGYSWSADHANTGLDVVICDLGLSR
jgi:hypothetical protein